ncbi:MAG: Crp/Fnr family transcriptional regulator [Sphingomonas sp.]|nr:Crp/Fnr family transcriptional regulator [Sphingomonas sp.]MDX3886285.1 Crp/Fnr family transcriptional regulator [Sphingomonas sp.]
MKSDERASALALLRRTEWLGRHPAELAAALLDHGRLVRLNAGEWAQAEGDERDGLFVVLHGLFHSYCQAPGDREVMLGASGAGAVLGHATRFSGGPRLVTAICAEPGVVLEIGVEALERIGARHPELWRAIADSAYANVRNALQMVAEVIALPPRPRLAARLLAAAGRSADGTAIVRLSQEQLGETAGLSRKTTSQHLATLEAQGLIDRGYGHIILRDLAGIERVAREGG